MATREIKTRFKLEGEQEFKRAMTDAANATKVLDSEMKLAQAQFKQTGDAEAYAAEQSRILREKIDEQKSAVHAAEAAMKALADNGVSKNDRTYQMWATRLNNAKTTLTDLETQLGKTEEGFEDVNDAAGSTDSKLDSIDKELRFQNTIKILEDVRDRFNQIIRGAARAGKAIWDMESDAGRWADDLATAASQAGVDVETYQSWQYASRFIDTSVDDIGKSVRKLEGDLGSTNEEVAKTFNQLGVATRNADGSVRDATAVFWDTVDALGRVEDATKRGIYAQTLLGSHYNNLNPLIEAGSKAYKDMAEEGRRVAVVDEEQVKKLGELNDSQEKMDAILTKTKETLLGEIAPAFQTITDGISTAAEAFNDFLASEEGRAAMAGLNEALQGVIESFLGEDNGKGTFQAIVEGATEAVNAFTAAMEWIKANADTVKAGLAAIAGVWATLNVAPGMLKAIHEIQQINWSGISNLFGGGKGSAASAASSAAGAGSRQALREGASLSENALLHAAAKAETLVLAEMAAESAYNMYKEIRDQGTLLGTGPGNTDAQGNWQIGQSGIYIDNEKLEEVRQLLTNFAPKAQEAYRKNAEAAAGESALIFDQTVAQADAAQTSAAQLRDTASDALDQILEMKEALEEAPGDNMEGLYGLIDSLTSNAGVIGAVSEDTRAMIRDYKDELSGFGAGSAGQFTDAQTLLDQLFTDLSAAYDAAAAETAQQGAAAADSFAQGLTDGAPAAADAADSMGQQVNTAVEQETSFLDVFGYNAAQGFADGIYDGIPAAVGAAEEMVAQVQSVISSGLDIHSPSRVLMRMGEFTAQGFAAGIDAGMAGVEAAAARMGRAAMAEPTYRSGGSWGADPAAQQADAGAGASVNATILMDKTVVGRLVAPIVNDTIGAAVASARR